MTNAKKKLVHLFDVTQCVGCKACIVACAETNYPDMLNEVNSAWDGLPANIRVMTLEKALRHRVPLRRELSRSRHRQRQNRSQPLHRLRLLRDGLPVRCEMAAPQDRAPGEMHGRGL